MALFLAITGFVLLVMETIVGVVANGSIVLVCCIDLFRSRKLPPTDLILICLASSRLLWQAVIILHVTMLSFFLHMYVLKEFHLITVIVWFFAETLGLWFATCLSVWYLIKIAVFSHPIFLQVKQRLSGMVPELLLGSVVVSVFVTIIKAVIIFTGSLGSSALCDPYKALLNNSRDPGLKKPRSCMDLAISCIVPNAIPAVIFLSSTILLILSLWKHTRHLQHSGIGVRDLNTNAHLSAIKAMASFAVLYLFTFIVTSLQSMVALNSNDLFWASEFVFSLSCVYPAGHAVILILLNPKLKQAWVQMLPLLKFWVSESPS